MIIESVLTGGGTAGLIMAGGYAYRQWTASRRERRDEPREATSAAVGDAAAANGLLLASLREEREEVLRLSGRVQEMEMQNALLYEKLRDQRREYEAEISRLREQVNAFQAQLDDLQSRLRADERED